MTTTATAAPRPDRARRRRQAPAQAPHAPAAAATSSSSSMALVWLFPVLWAVLNSFRDYDYTVGARLRVARRLHARTTTSTPGRHGDFGQHFLNSVIITVPAVADHAVPRLVRGVRGRPVQLLAQPRRCSILFTAGNLLPQQAMLMPLYRLFNSIQLPFWLSDSGSLYDSYWAVIIIHVAFQIGFCAFVLSNYMKTLPKELTEAALVDGAGVLRQFWQIILPLCRPPLAALATLEITWIYNDFFWAVVLHEHRRQVPDHVVAEEPAGPVLHRLQPALGRLGARRDPDPDRLLRAAEAVRLRA